MAFLSKGKKIDLFNLATELRIAVNSDDKILDLREKITNSTVFKNENEFVKETFTSMVEERKKQEEVEDKRLEKEELERKQIADEKRLAEERQFELEKLKLQTATLGPTAVAHSPLTSNQIRMDLKNVLPIFLPEKDDMSLFLTLFERQMKLLDISADLWVSHLIGVLPHDIGRLIAREPEEMFKNYSHIRTILLQRFKLTAERHRILFSRHHKRDNSTWKDFYFEVRNYFEGWISELDINSFEKLKELIIADQIKKKCPPDYKNHYLDGWERLNDPVQLAEKLDLYENIKMPYQKFSSFPKTREVQKTFPPKHASSQEYKKNEVSKNEHNEISSPYKNTFPHSRYMNSRNVETNVKRPPISCYGCGKQGFIKVKCPNCSPSTNMQSAKFDSIQLQSCSIHTPVTSLLSIMVNGVPGVACADTAATHTMAGEKLFKLLCEQGTSFKKTSLQATLADGLQRDTEILQANVNIEIEGRKINTTIFALPEAKENRTLLGIDFLRKMGIVLDIPNQRWYFHNNPRCKFSFADTPFRKIPYFPKKDAEVNPVLLRQTEGQHLSVEQKRNFSKLLENFSNIFQPGGDATPFVEHHINTVEHQPISVPPYRLSPAKKELLKNQIDDLLAKGIIEECESPYSAPVVLIPKPNGSVRLCVDYRKLNAVTTPDTYPLPRMDDLLHQAKTTEFMSTLDLNSGYHQVNVYGPDRDKTAFVCPLGSYRFRRMPFGLRNAPATFQRLMDNFRKGLPNVNILTYLDDIIVLSPSFEQHMSDLEAVFKRLEKWNLSANREKCNFACSRVKYLGHWITPNGLEVDPEKVCAITQIAPPKNVKQLQSFLQTCSWYRRFIPNFAEVSRPLSNLTKKKTQWHWGADEENAFQALKHCLVSTPILQQADETKPFAIRTDASGYALGAVLLQGTGAEEHPIEYASRLLNSAERNYSTTEREALAVIWALNKFRGYIDGTEVSVASDHQPLKWLMSLKSPSGRLARWALQLQEFNVNIEYIPGKANVIADMLSRPICNHTIEEDCNLCTVILDIPARNSSDLRTEQMKDEKLKKIIESFEDEEKSVDYTNWTARGYIMNQGILYRYSPSSEAEEAQLVVPTHEREKILKEHHDSPTAGHYGVEGTLSRISKRYYWTDMRAYIADYVKHCAECNRYKPSNQKPSGLLQTPVYSQRFEVLSIDLFGPLPESKTGKRWIFIVEDCATKWVELFALTQATAKQCAITLLEEVILRYGLPRRIISDNGSQFVSSVMQQLCFLLDIKQSLTPIYHPQANPVERKNRDLKPRLAILVEDDHGSWEEKLPSIRFAMNTATCDTTGQTPAFLQFGRELRTTDDVKHDIRAVIQNDNFVPEITPYLKKFANMSKEIKERVEAKQDERKRYFDRKRQKGPHFTPGDKVWVTLHPVSKASSHKTSKFMPRRDGPYIIITQKSPTTFEIGSMDNPSEPLATCHISALKPCNDINIQPVAPIRKRGRPPKKVAGSLPGRQRNQRGRL